MLFHSRSRSLRLIAFAGAVFVLATAGARADAQTRQVSVESFIYDLNSPDPLRRQAAARQLGAVKHKPAIPNLIALSHDPVAAVRRDAELSLEQMQDIQTLLGFVAFSTDTENDIRARATGSLVRMHLPRTTGVIPALTKLGELIVLAPDRELELVVEPDMPIDPIVISTLRTRLDDSERRIRRTAIRGLGILRAQPAVPDLLRIVREDRDDGLRIEGIRSLRKIGDTSIAEHFVPLININSDAVRNELMTSLGAMRYRGAVPELMRFVDESKQTDGPTIVALAALADIADPASLALFERLKGDRNEFMRLYANEGLARTADPSMKAAISGARLVEKSTRVRTAQAFALLRIGETEYLDELVRALERSATRDLAKEYLLETQPTNRSALFAPRPASPAVRAELADVLGRIGDPDALPRLQELARDPDGDVARAAERATRRLALVSSIQ